MKNYLCALPHGFEGEEKPTMLRTTVLLRNTKPEVRRWKREGAIQGAKGVGEREAGLLVKATVGWVLI